MTKNRISDSDSELFRSLVGKILPNGCSPDSKTEPTQAINFQFNLNTDYIEEISAEQNLFFASGGLQTKLIKKLRQGALPIEARLDLHRLTIFQAQATLAGFLNNCLTSQKRHLLIIHGKGVHSKQQKATLKSALNSWLRELPNILAFCSAQPKDGGTGAVYVLLKKIKECPCPITQ